MGDKDEMSEGEALDMNLAGNEEDYRDDNEVTFLDEEYYARLAQWHLAKRVKKGQPARCAWCGELFTKKHPSQAFHDRRCKQRFWNFKRYRESGV